jgi:hypothetical protein
MVKTFKDMVKASKMEFKDDRFTLDLINLTRLCEEYYCSEGQDTESDQFDFWAWMRCPLEEDWSPDSR